MPVVVEPRRRASPQGEVEDETRLAPRYRVIVHNDDVTPMDVVVWVLLGIFKLEVARARDVMLEAHETGCAHVTTLSLEEAELRCEQAHAFARKGGYPLTFTYEPES